MDLTGVVSDVHVPHFPCGTFDLSRGNRKTNLHVDGLLGMSTEEDQMWRRTAMSAVLVG
jgi:hypothetical protein